MTKLVNIQHLRAVAAVTVVVAHLGENTNDLTEKFGDIATLPNIYGTFGVDIFFVISGFIMYYTSAADFGRPGAISDFLKRRLIRIVPIYWILTLVQAAILFVSRMDEPARQITWEQMAKSLFFIPYLNDYGKFRPILGVGWSLNFEMLFYAIFAIALLFPKRLGMAVMLLTIPALVTLGSIATPSGALLAWTMPVMLEFVAGVVIGIAFQRGMLAPRLLVPMLIATLALVVIQEVVLTSPNVPHQELSWRVSHWAFAIAIMLGALVTLQANEEKAVNRVVTKIGDASYSLYLTHVIVLQFTTVAATVAGASLFHPLVYFACVFVVILPVAWYFHVKVEAPLTRYLAKRFTKRPVPVGMEPQEKT